MKLRYVLIVAGLAALSGFAAGPAVAKAQVIRLTSVTLSSHNTKTGSVEHDSDVIAGRVVGHDTVTCTGVSKNTARCRVTFVRPSLGTLYLRFTAHFNASNGRGVVTGGTRAYAGARGTFTYRFLNKAGTRAAVVLHLR